MVSVRIFGTTVRAKIIALVLILGATWACVTWLGFYWHPERGFWQGLLIGLVTALLLLVVEFGHDLAHIISARYAGAPMDEVLISLDMPRTLYTNNDVSPNVHRMRALGGPIFNATGLLLSLVIYGVASANSMTKELAGWWALGHGLQLIMSVTPVPPVDGGTILKWTLVASGRTETEADEIVRRIGWALGIGVAAIGAGLIVMQMWMTGAILVGIGAVVIGAAAADSIGPRDALDSEIIMLGKNNQVSSQTSIRSNYSQMLPGLVSCFCAYAVTEFLKDLPIYEAFWSVT